MLESTRLAKEKNLSIVSGNHTIKVGGEIRRDRFNSSGSQLVRGSFSFDGNATQDPNSPGNTGYSFADYLLGWSQNSTRALGYANTMLRAMWFRNMPSPLFVE